jgi:hypothetical protein
MKDLITGASKPLPKNSLQTINKHLDWDNKIDEYDHMLEEFAQMDTTPSI